MQRTFAWVGFVCSALVACGGGTTPEPEAPEPMAEETAAPEPEPMPDEAAAEKSAEPAEEAAPEPAKPEPLTDEQIAAVTEAANTSEVDQAKLAQKQSKNARVKKFAAMMISDHNKAKQKQSSLLKKLKVTPAENPVSTELTEDSTKTMETLKALKGPEFDKAYIDGQVSVHTKVLETFDSRLIPSAQNADLKAALEELRPKLEAHLTEAKAIQEELAAAPAPEAAAGAEKKK